MNPRQKHHALQPGELLLYVREGAVNPQVLTAVATKIQVSADTPPRSC